MVSRREKSLSYLTRLIKIEEIKNEMDDIDLTLRKEWQYLKINNLMNIHRSRENSKFDKS
jgi:hypothetical protein